MKSKLVPKSDILDFFTLLNTNKITYLLIKNVAEELPDNLKDGKDIAILVHIDDWERFTQLMSKNGFLYRIHPFGSEQGWHFAYNLKKLQFWQKKGCSAVLYINVCFHLCVQSLTPKTWVPLDAKIQEHVWEHKQWNETLQCPVLDEKTLFVYLIAHSVFDKRTFSTEYIAGVEKLKHLLDDAEVQEKLSCVFYKFTDTLILLIKNSSYAQIVTSYLTFTNY